MSFMAAASILVVAVSVGVGLLKVQRDRAERNFALAQQAVQDYFIRVSEETLLNQPGMQSLRDVLIRQALDYYEQFLKERQHDANLQREVALANFYVGRITETLESPIKALPHFESAAAIQQALLDANSGRAAHELISQYAQTLNAIGRVQQNLERLAEARQYYERAADLRQEVASTAPQDAGAARELASTLMNLGLIELTVGNAAGALEFLERAQALRLAHADDGASNIPLQRDLGMGYYNAALAHLALEDRAAAKTNLQGTIEVFSRLADLVPGDLDNRRRLAIAHRILGDVQGAAGDVDAALESHHTARAELERLSANNPDVAAYVADLAGVQMNLAQQLYDTGDRRRALDEVQAAVTALRKLAKREAALPRHHRDLGVALRFAGQLLAEENQVEEARASLEESEELLQALARQYSGESSYAAELKATVDLLAELNAI